MESCITFQHDYGNTKTVISKTPQDGTSQLPSSIYIHPPEATPTFLQETESMQSPYFLQSLNIATNLEHIFQMWTSPTVNLQLQTLNSSLTFFPQSYNFHQVASQNQNTFIRKLFHSLFMDSFLILAHFFLNQSRIYIKHRVTYATFSSNTVFEFPLTLR